MTFVRWVIVSLSKIAVSLEILLLAVIASLFLTILNAGYIKSTLASSGVYNNLISDSLKSTSDQSIPTPSNTQNDIITALTPTVQHVVTPAFLQLNVNKVIDGYNDWLHGKTAYPTFTLDFSQIKAGLSEQINQYIQDRYVQLPICSRYNMPSSFDPLNADCRPNITPSASDFATATNNYLNEVPFLKNDQVTFATFNTSPDQPSSKTWQTAPKAYRWASLAPYILTVLSIIGAVIIIFLSRNKAKGWRRIGNVFTINGALLLIVGLTSTLFLADRFNDINIGGNAPADQAKFINDIFIPFSQKLVSSIGRWILIFGIIYIVIGIVSYYISHRLKSKVLPAKVDDQPVEKTDDKPGDKPIEKTDEKPVEKLDDKPTGETKDKSSDKPETTPPTKPTRIVLR